MIKNLFFLNLKKKTLFVQEFQEIRKVLERLGKDVRLLDIWYKQDSNTVPPVNVLQPIHTILGKIIINILYW